MPRRGRSASPTPCWCWRAWRSACRTGRRWGCSNEGAMDEPISLDTVVRFLVATPLFDGLDPAERAEVVRIMEVEQRSDGEDVFHEGDLGDAWYVIYSGTARVLKAADSGAWQIRMLERGACFGEMAILD